MPRARKVCSTVGCVNIADVGQSLCSDCAKARRQAEPSRPSAASRGYDAAWRKLRNQFLIENPFCVLCGAPAVVVDHKIPRRAGGDDSRENLQSLCKKCHDQKTAKNDGGFGNEKKFLQGEGALKSP